MRVAEGDAHDVHNCAVVITAIPKRMSWPLRREPAASFPLPARMRGRGKAQRAIAIGPVRAAREVRGGCVDRSPLPPARMATNRSVGA